MRRWSILTAIVIATATTAALPQGKITTPKEQFGFNIGDNYHLATYTQLTEYWKKLDAESDRMRLVSIGKTEDGRDQWMAIITSPANFAKLDRLREISARLSRARLTDEEARALAKEGRAVVWIDGGLHATEVLGAQQLLEHVYRMVSKNDEETLRILDDVVQLVAHANPDGMELVSTAYMRDSVPSKRSMGWLPVLYQKYAGHDNNRDFYMNALAESKNISRVLYREWYPQVVYNHHQTAPAGAVMFAPPFRAPNNYNLDPILINALNSVGDAMHTRFATEGKPGVVQREAASFQTWWNGGLRTTPYFHNQVGILTETTGSPTPGEIPVMGRMLVPDGGRIYPIMPQTWTFAQSLEYEITANRAILNYASRMREEMLFNIYLMGRNSIRRGSEDTWTLHPKLVKRMEDEFAKARQRNDSSAARGMNRDFFNLWLRRPEDRDPRGYVLPANQADFLTATRFVNALIESGVEVSYAKEAFSAGGRHYPAGSYVIMAAQAFRPHVLDMMEPQDYPNDVAYPGGPPIAPYDNAGYTLVLQMGVRYDRLLEGFDCPCVPVTDVLKRPPVQQAMPVAQGYLLSRKALDSYRAVNRLLQAREKVEAAGADFYVPATPGSTEILSKLVAEYGLPVYAANARPADATELKRYRIGLWDTFGGSSSSGWVRWILERYEFPFELVYAPTLDEDNLDRFEALIFVDGSISAPYQGGGYRASPEERARQLERIPAQYRKQYGSISQEITIPRLKEFVEKGGRIITIGSAIAFAQHLGLPIDDHLVERGPNGERQRLSSQKFYVPTSLLDVTVDNTAQSALGMDTTVVVTFDHSPVMRLLPTAVARGVRPVAWFSRPDPLRSGWAMGGSNLEGGVAIAEAKVGQGMVYLFAPDITFRAQPYGTFRFLFNGIVGQ